MTWVRLDDGFYRHPKARAVGKDGRALYLAGLCWASSNLTDGHIPSTVLPVLLADAEVKATAAAKLVEVGWWHPTGSGWEIHNYLDRNRSKEAVQKERARWRRQKSDNGSAPTSTVETDAEAW